MEKPILITAAMEGAELEILKKELNNLKRVEEKIATFYEGEILNYPVVLCHIKVGTINASASVTEAILKYSPIAIIVQGIAGGHAKNIHTGDLVVSTEVFPIHSIKTPKKDENQGSNPFEWEILNFKEGDDSSEDIEILANTKLLEESRIVKEKFPDKNIFFGRIGSGDVWNSEVDRINYFAEKYQTLCEEMEGIAIFQIADYLKIPVINIRAISNHEVFKEPYQKSAGDFAQEFTIELTKRHILNIKGSV